MKKIVFIGGGGGITNIAPGLRDHFDVTAIMTTFDDGGSTGRLKEAYQSPLVGDIRRAFAVLSTNRLGDLLNHRFDKADIRGHAFGNMLLTAVFNHLKDPHLAMEELHHLLDVRGRVIGVSYDISTLHAELEDGSTLRGEHTIDEPHEKGHLAIKKMWLDPVPEANQGALDALRSADLLIMGPGDVYTSFIPNLLVSGIKEAIQDSTAKKVYFCNLFTKFGQTNNFSACDHVQKLEEYLEDKFDAVVLCDSPIPEEVIVHHLSNQEKLVIKDIDRLSQEGYDVHSRDLLDNLVHEQSGADALIRSKLCYAPNKVLSLIKEILVL